MDISAILGELEVASDKRILSISTDSERFVLPVTPWKINVQLGQNNKTVDILDSGEMLVFGNRKLHRLKFSCFFPDLNHRYPYVVNNENTPRECIEILNRMKTSGESVHVILSDSTINQYFAIEEISYQQRDGSGDIYYDLDLIEVRDFVLPESNYQKKVNSLTGLKDRAGVRSSESVTSFLQNISSDVSEAYKAISGKTAIPSGGGGSSSDSNTAISDVANIYMGFSTGNINANTINSTIRVISNPGRTLKGLGKGVVSIVKNPIKAVGKIFGF